MHRYDNSVAEFSLKSLVVGDSGEALRSCVKERGVFYLTETGLSPERHDAVRDRVMTFFKHGTEDEKRAMSPWDRTIRRGYSGLESESTARVTNQGEYSDYSMCFSMGRSRNLFPSSDFEATLSSYFQSVDLIARQVARATLSAAGYDVGEDEADGPERLFGDPVMRFRYFPDVPEARVYEREPSRMASHYDLSVVTLIHQTPCANGFVSLQAEIGGQYVDLPAMPDALVVMCGAVATIVADGKVTAPKHHVAAPPSHLRIGSERTSTVFFLRPQAEFDFSVQRARFHGLDVCVDKDRATFADWIGTNYKEMHTSPDTSRQLTPSEGR